MGRKPNKKRGVTGYFRVRTHGKCFVSTISWADANRQAEAYKRDLERGLHADARSVTVAAYAHKWLPLHKSGVSDKVYNEYARYMNALIDQLGHYAMIDITVDDAMSMFVHVYKPRKAPGDEGYSGSVIRKVKMLYRDFFDAAVENGYALRNPFRSSKISAISGIDGTHRQITDEERRLIHAVQHPFRRAVMTMLYAGLRRGEVLALNADTDIRGGEIHVSRAVAFDSNAPRIKTPKSDAGIRVVPVFPPLAAELEGAHGLIAPSARGRGEMSEAAFSSAWGSYVLAVECHLNGVAQRRWYGITRADRERDPERYRLIMDLRARGRHDEADKIRLAGWRTFDVRPHDLRHSYCVMLRDAGVDIKQAVEWMGHADEKMILKIYDHITTRRTAQSVQKVEDLIENAGYLAVNLAIANHESGESVDT